jgi:putative transposase
MFCDGTPCDPRRSASARPRGRFIGTHLALLAGTDFFTAEGLTLRDLVTSYVLLANAQVSPNIACAVDR